VGKSKNCKKQFGGGNKRDRGMGNCTIQRGDRDNTTTEAKWVKRLQGKIDPEKRGNLKREWEISGSLGARGTATQKGEGKLGGNDAQKGTGG